MESVLELDARLVKVEGPARSGKTQCIVDRVSQLIDNGVDPKGILVTAATAFAVQEMRKRLSSAIGPTAEEVAVKTPMEECVDVLTTPDARKALHRTPRVLNPMEKKFFLEDLKTSGMKIRKLRRMMRFVYANWAACNPESEWAPDGSQEASLMAMMRALLVSQRAMLAEEAPFLVASLLKSDAGRPLRHAFSHVLCDDYQNMSHSAQTVLCMRASEQVIVCGNPNETVALGTRFPNPQGFVDFDSSRHGVETVSLSCAHGSTAVQRFVNELAAQDGMNASEQATAFDGSDGQVELVKWATPEEEINGTTKIVRKVVDETPEGADDPVCLVVPNKRWAVACAKVMRKRGITFDDAGVMNGISGDPRDEARCATMRAFTALSLIARPDDVTSWRCWCGYGDYLTNSDAWKSLGEYARNRGVGMLQALRAVSIAGDEPFPKAKNLAARYRKGQELISENKDRRGFSLLKAVGATGRPEFATVESNLAGDETASQVFQMVAQGIFEPRFSETPHDVCLCYPSMMCGLRFTTVAMLGMVNGFIPRRDAFETVSTAEDRSKTLCQDRRAFYAAASKAEQRLMVTFFTKSDLELAERSKMQVDRVFSEHGKRTARVSRSVFVDEADAESPGTTGGQQLLMANKLE